MDEMKRSLSQNKNISTKKSFKENDILRGLFNSLLDLCGEGVPVKTYLSYITFYEQTSILQNPMNERGVGRV